MDTAENKFYGRMDTVKEKFDRLENKLPNKISEVIGDKFDKMFEKMKEDWKKEINDALNSKLDCSKIYFENYVSVLWISFLVILKCHAMDFKSFRNNRRIRICKERINYDL